MTPRDWMEVAILLVVGGMLGSIVTVLLGGVA